MLTNDQIFGLRARASARDDEGLVRVIDRYLEKRKAEDFEVILYALEEEQSPPPPRIWKTHDKVLINGHKLGCVLLASENGRSLALGFSGLLRHGGGFFVGMMPILFDPRQQAFLDLKTDSVVTLADPPQEESPS